MELSQVRAVFFKAMKAGYALEGVSKATDMFGYKEIRHGDGGDLLVVDRWYTNPESERSAGTTTISYKGKPVWIMHYGGQYSKECIPFLKQALRSQYMMDKWNGGRGPSVQVCQDSGLIYRNKTEINSFTRFKGHEVILASQGRSTRSLGHHDYWGMSLL